MRESITYFMSLSFPFPVLGLQLQSEVFNLKMFNVDEPSHRYGAHVLEKVNMGAHWVKADEFRLSRCMCWRQTDAHALHLASLFI